MTCKSKRGPVNKMKIKERAVNKLQIEKGRQESFMVVNFANNILKKNA